MGQRILQWLREPIAPLIPWAGLALLLLAGWVVVEKVALEGAERQRHGLEKEWAAARHTLAHHREGRALRKDLSRVWAMLPSESDFAPLALGISEEAKKDRIALPALSSKTEPTAVAHVHKGVLQGSMSGKYEDLRRFIYDLETAEEPLFIEDLELAKAPGPQSQSPTFNIKIATYLRGDATPLPSSVQVK